MTEHRSEIVPVILSGGSGTRLWPASRARQPKQLLRLVGERSLIQQTVDRVGIVGGVIAPIVVTNESHATAIERALASSELGEATMILEPVGRNTAPAVAVAAHEILRRHGDRLMLVLPSDHAIADREEFARAVEQAATIAADGSLVTFGITPTSPETGYGYIRAGEPLATGAFRVAEFREKPDLATAEAYVTSGDYSWNSGMFLFGAERYLDELERWRPDIATAAERAFADGEHRDGRILLPERGFGACPAVSVDYAVMEPTDRAAVVRTDPGWSDVGSWSSLWAISDHDADGNTVDGDAVAVDTTNSLIRTTDRLVATVGLDGIVVVDTPDALLVTSLDASQDVKAIVETLAEEDREEITTNGTTFEPWGVWERLNTEPGHVVRVLTIDPGAETPERVRSDAVSHLRILRGEGEIVLAGVPASPRVGEAVFVPSDQTVSIRNTGETALMVIEMTVDTVVDEQVLSAYVTRRLDPWGS